MSKTGFRQDAWLATGTGAIITIAAIALTFGGLTLASRVGHPVVIAMVVVAMAGLVTFFLPVDTLPALALVAYVFIPRTVLALQNVTDVFTPSFVIIIVWALRSYSRRDKPERLFRAPTAARVLAIIFVLWMVVSLLLNRVIPTSLVWMLDFTVLVLIPLFVPFTQKTIENVQKAFLVCAVILAVYCTIEFAAQFNPLQPLLGTLGIPDVQHWSVYRSYATLGHPLYAGLFFAIAFAIALGRKLEARGRFNISIAAISLLGLLTTVSRNSIGAVAVASGLMIIASLVTRSRLSGVTRVALGAIVGAAAIGVTQAPVFQDRLDSSEAAGSTAARDAIVSIALRAAEAHSWLGGGPGNSLIIAKPYNVRETIIENAYLQLLISVGIPGLVIFALLFVGGAVWSFRSGSFVGIGAATAYAFSIGFFNIIETSQASLILGGIVLLLAWGAAASRRPAQLPEQAVVPAAARRTRIA